MKRCSHLSSIIHDYDALILDLWGVIHDGDTLYPDVPECLAKLHASGKRILFLSNAPRRAHKAQQTLDKRGIKPEWYEMILTSGEMTYRLLEQKREAYMDGWTRDYYFLGPDRDGDILDGLDYNPVPMEHASFVLNVGFDDDEFNIEAYMPTLEAALQHELPMLCANPDDIVVKITGMIWPCAGLLAERYAEMGGTVHYVGKPYPDVYTHCLEQFNNIPKTRILAVGDNFATDIKGGNQAGIHTTLIAGGVLTHEVGFARGDMPGEAILCRLAIDNGAAPNYVLPLFRW